MGESLSGPSIGLMLMSRGATDLLTSFNIASRSLPEIFTSFDFTQNLSTDILNRHSRHAPNPNPEAETYEVPELPLPGSLLKTLVAKL